MFGYVWKLMCHMMMEYSDFIIDHSIWFDTFFFGNYRMDMHLIQMIVFSLLGGFLATMNIWAASCDHVRFHLNDVYMVALMTLWMVLFSLVYNYQHPHQIYLIII